MEWNKIKQIIFFNKLRFVVNTKKGIFGRSITFEKGLNIISGNNSSGKSTCVNSIFYALGFEVIFGGWVNIGKRSLVTALKDTLTYIDEGVQKEVEVIDSYIELEIYNKDNTPLTLKRYVESDINDKVLVVTFGHSITNKAEIYEHKEYILRDPGSYTRERGFHFFLADFLSLELPLVPMKNSYEEKILYIQTFLPLMFIEQKSGWADVLANMHSYFRQNPIKYSIEFLLNLDIYANERKKREILEYEKLIKSKWNILKNNLKSYSEIIVGGILENFPYSIPNNADIDFPYINIMVERDKFESLTEQIISMRLELENLSKNVEKKSKVEDFTVKLTELNEDFFRLDIIIRELQIRKVEYFNSINNLNEKLTNIKEEKLKYLDLSKIKKYQSGKEIMTNFEECPVCKSKLNDILLKPSIEFKPMTIDENLKYLEQERNLISLLLSKNKNSLEVATKELEILNNKGITIKKEIKDINTKMIQPEDFPSILTIRKKVQLEEKLEFFEKLNRRFELALLEFPKIIEEFITLKKQKEKLKGELFSELDIKKIDCLAQFYSNNLEFFGFGSSIKPEIEISLDNYLPIFKKFQFSTELSATDQIRKIWSYTLALYQVSTKYNTNHFGFCIFDEPGQQKIDDSSLQKFYEKIISLNLNEFQIIVATSEKVADLEKLIGKKGKFIKLHPKLLIQKRD